MNENSTMSLSNYWCHTAYMKFGRKKIQTETLVGQAERISLFISYTGTFSGLAFCPDIPLLFTEKNSWERSGYIKIGSFQL